MNFNAFNLLDTSILILIGLSTLFAIFRGLVGSVLSLTGWALSIYLTYFLYPHIAPLVAAKISNNIAVTLIGYSGLMILFLIFFAILNAFLNSFKLLGSKFLDSVLGGTFGFFRGFVIASFFYLFLSIGISLVHGTDPKDEAKVAPQWLTQAETYDSLKTGKKLLLSFTPEDFNKRLEGFYENVSNKTQDERFIAYATEVMLKTISKNDREKIEKDTAKDYLTYSDEEIELKTLKSLMQAYKKQPGPGSKKVLTQDDLKRLEEIINNLTRKQS